MSQTIDNRVVEMVFDNKNFEKGVGQTLNSLENLNKGLNKIDGRSLDTLSASANNVDLSRISEGVEALTRRFSTLGIVGMSVINNLTTGLMGIVKNGLNQIVTGGARRAANIEQARFMLQGLKKDVDKFMADADYAVSGTAYGLDAAAKAAAQFAASGIDAGDEMRKALRGISGVAAMTNSSYEEISQIFTRVAGTDRLYATDLNSISFRGINAAATLAEYLNKVNHTSKYTEKTVHDMVSKGTIDFKTFAAAMDDAFGDQSQKANETFTGALSNVNAALSRIGEKFQTPYRDNLRKVFVALIPVLNGVKAGLQPVIALYSFFMEKASGVTTKFLNSLVKLDKEGKFVSFSKKIQPLIDGLNKLVKLDKDGNFAGPGQALMKLYGTLRVFRSEHSTFDGLISAFEILKSAGENLLRGIKPLGNTFGIIFTNIGRSLLVITDAIGRYITRFKDFTETNKTFIFMGTNVRHAIERFNRMLTKMFEILGKASGSLVSFIKNTGIVSTVLGVLADAFNRLKDGVSGYKERFSGVRDALKSMGDYLKNTHVSKILDTLADSFGRLGKIFAAVGTAIGSGIHALLSVLQPGDFRPLLQLINGGLFTAILYGMSNMFRTFNGYIKKFESGQLKAMGKNGPLFTVLRTLDQLRDTLFAYERTLKADILLKIAGAVAVLAGSLWLLSSIDQKKLLGAIAALGVLLTFLTSSFVIINKMLGAGGWKGEFANMMNMYTYTRVGTMLLLMAGAIMVLAEATRRIADLNPDELARGLKGVTVLIVALMGMLTTVTLLDRSKHATGLKGIVSTSLGLLIMAEAIGVLSKSVEKLGALDTDALIKGLATVVALMSAMMLFTVAARDSKRMTSIGVGLLIMAEAIAVLGKSVEKLGNIDAEVLIKGLGAVITLLISLGAFTRIAGGSKNMITISVGLLILVEALKRLWEVVLSFGVLDTRTLAKGLISVAAALGVMAGALLIIKRAGSGIRSAASIYILAEALTTLTGVIKDLGEMNGGSIAKALVSIAGALIVMGGALRLMGGNILGAAGIFVLVAALNAFVPVLRTLAYMPGENIAKALVALAASFAVLGGAAALLSPLIPAMVGLAGALALLGLAVTAFGGGIALLGIGFRALSGLTSDSLVTITETLGFIAEAIAGFVVSLGEHAVEFAAAGMKMLLAFLDGIRENIGHIAGVAFEIAEEFIRKLSEKLPDLIDAGVTLIVALIDGLATAIYSRAGELAGAMDRLVGALAYFALEALKTIVKHLPGGEMFAEWIDSLENDIVEEFDLNKMEEAGESMVKAAAAGTNAALDSAGFDTMGAKSGGHYASGIESKKQEVYNASSYLASESGRGFASENGIGGGHYNAGAYASEGFISGIRSKLDAVIQAGTDMASAAKKASMNELKEQSPSRVFIGIGQYVGAGFVIGIESYRDKVAKASANLAGMSIETANSLSKRLADSLSDDTMHPTISPVLDLSNVEAGSGRISSMFTGVSLGASLSFANQASASMRTIQNESQVAAMTADRLIRKMDALEQVVSTNRIDPELMYEAVHAGASNATPTIRINNRELNRELKDMGVAYR